MGHITTPLSAEYMRSLIGLSVKNRNKVKTYYKEQGRTEEAMKKSIDYAKELYQQEQEQTPIETPKQEPVIEKPKTDKRTRLDYQYSACFRGLTEEQKEKVLATYTDNGGKLRDAAAKTFAIKHAYDIKKLNKAVNSIFPKESSTAEKEKPAVVKSHCRALPGYGETPEEGKEVSVITHLFWLRPNLQIKIELPSNLTIEEAARLEKAIKSFVF